MKYLKVILASIALAVLILLLNRKEKTDDFYASGDFESCIEEGYTKEFCVKTPVSLFGPSVCMCDNGKVGRYIPGFKGKCICNEGLMGRILHS